jgi:hypothetical protein
MVCAVVLIAPDTIPSAIPLWIIMVPKYDGSAMVSLATGSTTPLCLRSSK